MLPCEINHVLRWCTGRTNKK